MARHFGLQTVRPALRGFEQPAARHRADTPRETFQPAAAQRLLPPHRRATDEGFGLRPSYSEGDDIVALFLVGAVAASSAFFVIAAIAFSLAINGTFP